MKLTNTLKKRFCKNYNIPIQIYEEPYWSSRIELFDNLFDTKAKLAEFEKDLSTYRDEQDYFEQDNIFLEEIIDDIRESEGFQFFNSTDNKDILPNNIDDIIRTMNYRKNDIYIEPCKNKTFISIDLKRANFQSLKYFCKQYNKEIFQGKETWEEYISIFTQEKTKINSKHLRQVIFGALNPSRVTNYEKKLMTMLLMKILEEFPEFKEKIASLNTDEIVIEIDKYNPNTWEFSSQSLVGILKGTKQKLIEICLEMGLYCEVDMFVLEKLGKDVWKKVFILDSNTNNPYKKVSSLVYPFVLRDEKGEEIQEEDRIFFYEGNKCKFVDNPYKKEVVENDK